MPKIQEFVLKDIRSNPFRDLTLYPIDEERVAELMESIQRTGVWPTKEARLRKDGKAELAYGHHTREAVSRLFGENYKVSLIIEDFTDADMLRRMALENMEAKGSGAIADQQTVKAVVDAFASGKIELSAVPPDTSKDRIRYAPSFVTTQRGDGPMPASDRAYTTETLADFLGWRTKNKEPLPRLRVAIGALELIERKILKPSDFSGLGTSQAGAVVQEARRSWLRRENEARIRERQVEEAQKAAEEAEKQQARAEAERAKREKEAAKAKDETTKREALRRAKQATKDKSEAERQHRLAVARQKDERKRIVEIREEGKSKAREVGQKVVAALKSGEGYKRAPEIAAKVDRPIQVPQHLSDEAEKLFADINKILGPTDPRTNRLEGIERWKDSLSPYLRVSGARTLQIVGERFARHFAILLEDGHQIPALPSGEEN